jgi:glycosyltransferase involved in cell wall biosynthesis
LKAAPLILAWSDRALGPLRGEHADVVVLPPPVDGRPSSTQRDIAAVTYGGDPQKRQLELVLDSWQRARREDETLVVTGAASLPPREGIANAGELPRSDFHALLSRARVFIAAPRREDFGIAPLEALAHGCVVATTPSPGPYPARNLARELDPRLVTTDLAAAIRTALDDPAPDYAHRAAALLAPFRRGHVDELVAREVLPRLVRGFRR